MASRRLMWHAVWRRARQVAYRWKSLWDNGGVEALISKGKAGRKSKMAETQTQVIMDALVAGSVARGYKANLWTLPRVTALIKKLTGVVYHPGHVWRLLGEQGFSCQRPERRAIDRDEKKIRRWKQAQWPVPRERSAKKAEPLSLLTKAD